MRPLDLAGLQPADILKRTGAPEAKKAAAEALARLGIPSKKSEEYRYFDPKSLMEKDWEVTTAEQGEPKPGRRIVIEDGALIEVPGVEGVRVRVLDEGEHDTEHFDSLYHLSHLLSPRTVEIAFEKDAKVELVHRFTRTGRLIPGRIVVRVADNVTAKVVERFEGEEACGAFVLGGWDAVLAPYGALKWYTQQTLRDGDYTPILSHRVFARRGAYLGMHTFDFGAGSGLQPLQVKLEKDAEAKVYHLLYATDEAKRGVVSKIWHVGEHAHSDQRAKSILADKARGFFDALIRVDHSGKYAVAHQNSRSILLNDGAYMAAKPQLEIYIDDLEASHGATVGQLDEAQLFYLRSRGIALSEAKKMLILAFANEMIDLVDDESVQAAVHGAFEKVYYGENRVACMETCHGCEEAILNAVEDNKTKN